MANAQKSHGNAHDQLSAKKPMENPVVVQLLSPRLAVTCHFHRPSLCKLGLNTWFHTVKLHSVFNSTQTQAKPLKPTKRSPEGSVSSAPKIRNSSPQQFFLSKPFKGIQSYSKVFRNYIFLFLHATGKTSLRAILLSGIDPIRPVCLIFGFPALVSVLRCLGGKTGGNQGIQTNFKPPQTGNL